MMLRTCSFLSASGSLFGNMDSGLNEDTQDTFLDKMEKLMNSKLANCEEKISRKQMNMYEEQLSRNKLCLDEKYVPRGKV